MERGIRIIVEAAFLDIYNLLADMSYFRGIQVQDILSMDEHVLDIAHLDGVANRASIGSKTRTNGNKIKHGRRGRSPKRTE